MLRSYPGEVTRRMLTSLLRDECATYTDRAAAYDVLRDQGTVVPKPLLDDCRR